VQIFRDGKQNRISVHYLATVEQELPDSAEVLSEVERGFQEQVTYCPAMGLL